MLCQNTMAVRVRAAASRSPFRMTSWSAPTAARPITAPATRSWASASTAPPMPPVTSGSFPTRRASSAPARPAASAPCGMQKNAAAAAQCSPRGAGAVPCLRHRGGQLRLLPDVPPVRRRIRPREGVLRGGLRQRGPDGRHRPAGLAGLHRPRRPRLSGGLQPDAAAKRARSP